MCTCRKKSLCRLWCEWSSLSTLESLISPLWERISPGVKLRPLCRRVLMPGWDMVPGKCFQPHRPDLCQTMSCLWKCLWPGRVAAGNLLTPWSFPAVPQVLVTCPVSLGLHEMIYSSISSERQEWVKVIFY